MIALERSYTFSSSHLYRRPDWTEERNRAVFGKCANLPAHGHNYRLTVRVVAPVDPETGFSYDLVALDRLVKAHIVDRLDHRHVNDVIAEFASGRQIPTTENLAIWMAGELGAAIGQDAHLVELRLAEDDRLASVWSPD